MKKLTNLIGSYIVALILIALPVISGASMAGDWLERRDVDGVLIHPWLAILSMICLVGTIVEVVALSYVINDSE